MGCVYQVRNKINGMLYIGKTIRTLDERKYGHIQYLKRGFTYFNNAIKKYGIENFEWVILRESSDDTILCELEKYYIKTLGTKVPVGYNMTDGGDGISGYKQTEDTKRKRSISLTGIKRSDETKNKMRIILSGNKRRFGLKQSEETKNKIRKANTGKKLSDEHKLKLSVAGSKRRLSEETRAKISASLSGKIVSDETRKKLSSALIGNDRNLGHTHSYESKQKMREARLRYLSSAKDKIFPIDMEKINVYLN